MPDGLDDAEKTVIHFLIIEPFLIIFTKLECL
jgi:hypothetical protein